MHCLIKTLTNTSVVGYCNIMFTGKPPLGVFSDDEDGILESIILGGDDSEEEEQEEYLRSKKKRRRRIVVVAAAAAAYAAQCEDIMSVSGRSPAFCRNRLDWDAHVQNYLKEGDKSFRRFSECGMFHSSSLPIWSVPICKGTRRWQSFALVGMQSSQPR